MLIHKEKAVRTVAVTLGYGKRADNLFGPWLSKLWTLSELSESFRKWEKESVSLQLLFYY